MTNTHILSPDSGDHDIAIEALYACAFGPGRFAKAAARLREGNTPIHAFSILAFEGTNLVGACRLWPVVTGMGDKALFLGPIAVDKSARNAGLGRRLVDACLAAVRVAGDARSVILVGDMGFFDKMGFEIVPQGQLIMPGPVDPNRLLWCHSIASMQTSQGRLSVPRAASPTS